MKHRKLNNQTEIELTPKGVISNDEVYAELLLYMYRTGYNGIALDDGDLTFVTIQKRG